MEIKHTPGPWKVANNSRSVLAGTVKINQQAGPAAQSAAVEAKNEFTLRANAKLISAAPEMLEALTELVEWSKRSNGTSKQVVDKAKAAIAKAIN